MEILFVALAMAVMYGLGYKDGGENMFNALGCCEHGKNGICSVCDAMQTTPPKAGEQ